MKIFFSCCYRKTMHTHVALQGNKENSNCRSGSVLSLWTSVRGWAINFRFNIFQHHEGASYWHSGSQADAIMLWMETLFDPTDRASRCYLHHRVGCSCSTRARPFANDIIARRVAPRRY